MAAGGVEILRREDSRFHKKDFGYGESGSRVGNGVDRSDGVGSRPNRLYGRIEGRALGRFSSAGNWERRLDEVGLLELSREKKRKVSPIVWEKEEKDFRVSSKKRTAELDYVSVGEVLNSDIVESGNQVEEVGFSTYETVTFNGLLQQPEADVRPMQDGAEVEELVSERTISMSRWALEEDTLQHMSDGECTPHREKNSSTESGEFHNEGGLSGSDHRCGSGGSNFDCDSEDDDEGSKMDEPTTPPRVNMLQSCRNVFEYEKVNKINEGTYGVVYKAKDKKTGEIVALKKVKMDVTSDEYGFPLSSLREINILLSFRHPSIVNVKEVAMDDNDGVYMVMEHMEHDLKGLTEKMKEPFSIGEVKSLMLQLIDGVKYLHDNWVLHRDLKSSNLLLNKDGTLKICDFGMSRQYGSPRKPYTALVVTLWYRAPELLLGTKEYSTAVDMWSVGCIMAELIAKGPLFRGKNEVEQLDKIFRTLGTPNESIWPGFSKLPGSKAKFVKQPFNTLRKKFPATSFIGSPVLTDLGFDLLSRLLSYDPETRITAEEALNHRWFVEAPLPATDLRPSIFESQRERRYLSRGQ